MNTLINEGFFLCQMILREGTRWQRRDRVQQRPSRVVPIERDLKNGVEVEEERM